MNDRETIDAILASDTGAAPTCPFGTDPDEWTPYARALALVYVGYGESPEVAADSAARAIVNIGTVEAYGLIDVLAAELAPEDAPEPPTHWPDDWRERAGRVFG